MQFLSSVFYLPINMSILFGIGKAYHVKREDFNTYGHRSGIEPDVSLSKIYVRDFEELASAFVRFARVRFDRVRSLASDLLASDLLA